MRVKKIDIAQFRSYDSYQLKLDPKLTVIVGKNGAGKTNLLESLYVVLNGSSFRGADSDLLRYGREWWRVRVVFDDTSQREVRYEPLKKPAKHLLEHEQKKRFTYQDRLPVVLFEPQDLLFVSGSPSRRRSTIDTMLGLLSIVYKQTLGRYERTLLQRNKILSQSHNAQETKDLLFSWDVMLVELAQTITNERARLIDEINLKIIDKYQQIAGSKHSVHLEYQSSLPRDITATQAITLLDNALSLDIRRGTTRLGPHRDDVVFYLDSNEAKTNASRGEVRSLILALKLVYADLLEERFDSPPMVLLDDVFSELDESRQTNLLSHLERYQVVVTDTKASKSGKITLL
jgi:DNA replication and repair protein RecF